MSSVTHVVFAYGTLKRGQPNAPLMEIPENGKATYLGEGTTVKKFPLVVATEFNIPFLLPVEGEGSEVKGEIFEVDDTMLAALDELENHPNLYKRELTQITRTNPTQIQECWVYFLPRFKPEMLELPYISDYSSASKDHPPYVETYQREKGLKLKDMVLPD